MTVMQKSFFPAKDFAYSTVATAPSPADSGTSLIVAAGKGSLFPDPATLGSYRLFVFDANDNPDPATTEEIEVTAKSTDTFTIVRAKNGVSRNIAIGDQISLNYSKSKEDQFTLALTDGYFFDRLLPGASFTKSDSITFTSPEDKTAYYTLGRKLRINGTTSVIVLSSSYASSVTTVIVDRELPASVTSVELEIKAIDQLYGGIIVTNLNTINNSGFYTCFGTATGAPSADYSWFVTHQNSNLGAVSATQRAVAYLSSSVIIYERVKTSSTWGSWILAVTPTSAVTLTNKRNQKRVYSTTSVATLTPEISTYDKFTLTAQAEALTIANHAGTGANAPTDGEMILLDITCDGTARALTFGTNYVGYSGFTLPTTLVISKNTKMLFMWRAAISKYDLVYLGQQA